MGRRFLTLFAVLLLFLLGSTPTSSRVATEDELLQAEIISGAPQADQPLLATGKVDLAPHQQIATHRSQVTLAIELSEVSNLYAAQVHVHFDPQMLAVVDANEAVDGIQIAPGNFPDPALGWWTSYADNQLGDIDYSVTLLNPAPPVSGRGTLAVITFEALTVGFTEVRIHSAKLSEPGIVPITPIVGPNATIIIKPDIYPYYVSLPLIQKNALP